MAVNYTSLLGLAKPVTGTEAGTWGDVVNDYLTNYLEAAVAGAQTISGTQTAVTLTVTTATALVQAAATSAGSSQYQIINCTGNPASTLVITAPASSKVYLVINATSTNQSVTVRGAGSPPTTGITIPALTRSLVAWNGADYILIASNRITDLTGTLATGNGGTGLTTFTAANNAIYSTSSSALTAGTLPVAAGGTGLTSAGALGNGLVSNGSGLVSAELTDNRFINGGILVRQHGNLSTFGSFPGGGSSYVADQWIGFATNTDPSAGTNVSFTINDNQLVATASTLTGTSPQMGFCQRIEPNNCKDLSTSSVTVSFDAFASAATNFYVQISYANTAGSFPVTSVTGGNIMNASVTAIGSAVAVPVTTSLTRVSATIDLTSATAFIANGLACFIYVPITATSQVMRLGRLKFQRGTAATTYDARSYQNELSLCQRYYERTSVYAASTVPSPVVPWPYRTEKYAAPTISLSTPVGSSGVFVWSFYTNTSSGFIQQSVANSIGATGNLTLSSLL